MAKSKEEVKSKDPLAQRIQELEEQISKTKYNKRTQHAIGLYKAQLAKLKEKRAAKASGGKKGEGYAVRKTGDGTVVLLGFPSVGKSTLLNKLTNQESAVGDYSFTTLTVIPGTLEYNHAKIQILDVPGIVHGAASGTGRGKEVLAVIRNADLIIVMVDVFHPEHLDVLMREVYETGVRANQKKPDVKVEKTSKGGIRVGTTVRLTALDKKTVESVLKEFRINNAEVTIREDISVDELIDVIEGNKVYIPAVKVLNKIDMADETIVEKVKKKLKPDINISAQTGAGLEELKNLIFEKLDLMRIYLKEVDKKADLEEPLIIWRNATLRDLCRKLHKDFEKKFRFARIWGSSVKFGGMKIPKLGHVLHDEDVVELRMQ